MAINTDSVNKQVYDLIRKEILERELLPGERIDPKHIADENNISVMPVRDALRRLTSDGLVVTRSRVGFFVRAFSTKEISEVYDARVMYELHCFSKHMDTLKPEWIDSMYNIFQNTSDADELIRYDLVFHDGLVLASGNQFLISQYHNLSALFALGVQGGYRENMERARLEHMEILDSVRSGNRKNAVKLLEKHLETARVETIEIYSKYSKGDR